MPQKRSTSPEYRNTALCYVRKSWVREEQDQISPERQRAHVQAVCDAHGWKAEWYEDVDGHKSGMHEKNRPGWLALKARLGDPDVVALVANDLARLHRKGWRIGDLLDFVEQRNITLVLADPRRQIDFSTPTGRVFAQLSAIFDEYYATDISERWKASIAYRKSKGITVGRPPFGTKRDKRTGYLRKTDEGAWLLPDGSWIAGIEGDESPMEGAIWRGYADCAEKILTLYSYKGLGRERIAEQVRQEGYAYRDRDGQPAPLEVDDIRRVTNNWIEYGGAVLGKRAKERHPFDFDPESVTLDPDRAVFDVAMLRQVGIKQKERSVRPADRGIAKTNHPYPLSNITYCAHCEQLAQRENNPKLRSRLGGKMKSTYRHRGGVPCGVKKKSVKREVYEGDFLRLIKLLTIKPEMLERMTELAIQSNAISSQDENELEAQKSAAIAKCRRKLEAARHLYEDGELPREEYLRRKEQNEQEIAHWQAFTTESEKLAMELALCVDFVTRVAHLWETSGDEDRQGMARNLFEYITFDLEKGRIVDFRLKPWADRFLILCDALYPDDPNGGQAAGDAASGEYGNFALSAGGNTSSTIKGTNRSVSPVRVTGLHNLEDAISIILARLYAGFLLPDQPVTKKHIPKAERNAEIIRRYKAGEGLSELARAFGLSAQRVFQIVH